MTSTSSTQSAVTQYFQFNNRKLPKVNHVIEYVKSRTSKHLPVKDQYGLSIAIRQMANDVHVIWSEADCPPKSIPSIIKLFGKLTKKIKVLKKNLKRYELRKLDESVFDVLAEEKDRSGFVFDINFYDEQRISWKAQMEIKVNPDFERELEEDLDKQNTSKKRIRSQFSNFEVADSQEVDKVIHKVCFKGCLLLKELTITFAGKIGISKSFSCKLSYIQK